ncbi:ABC transporter ATP-binding protein [Desulfatitalea alkaliphila]|uniref:ABC transporter ATP-binding protein n=1 Tax=Desulfatitalea alkaliphila TaxID=2929485 RepID=A0AA41UHF9_9BACT|nr:ABC transporter ATP-binding protein [Desulfatitalea alkaliphila]MCJ8498989.1 ABC transporter ATP-binding protein [Desulfatitalea alkaliphila]
MHIIEAIGVVKRFGDLTAVDGVHFTVEKGEFFGFLGPNGAGKTSAIRMIYGFSPVTSGQMKVFGLDIVTDWRRIRSGLGICQQENTLDPDLTVEQNLLLYARYFEMNKHKARERAEELLQFFALTNKRHAKVMELSGGLARRLQLARAIMAEPALLILDEPTTGLDPQSRHQMWNRLTALKKKGLTMLLTTHYMDEAESLCDRLLIMDNGRIIAQGRPRDLIVEHAAENVIEIEGADEQLRTYVKDHDVKHDDLGERMIVYAASDGNLENDIRDRFCMDACQFRAGNLEDVFLRLTGRELRE